MAPSTWVIIGASRGIGLEFVRQLLERGDQVIAAVRNVEAAKRIWPLTGNETRPGSCLLDQCDVTDDSSIDVCVQNCPVETGVAYWHSTVLTNVDDLGFCWPDEGPGGQGNEVG